MSTAGQDRLFIPLDAISFRWWQGGRKHFEIRRPDKRRWNTKTCRFGRRVELRLGYSGESLWGTIDGPIAALREHLWRHDTAKRFYDEFIPGHMPVADPIACLSALRSFTCARDLYELLSLVAIPIQLDPGQGVGE
jgi:hypothetical protein